VRAIIGLGLVLGAVACAPKLDAFPRTAQRARLVERSVLPAATFGEGPPSGARLVGVPSAPFPSQPVQGFSSIQYDDGGVFLTVADNGYGVPENSADFELVARRLHASGGQLRAEPLFVLADPGRRLDWPLRNGFSAERRLTGADLDPESMVRAPDGTFWLGDEHGPFLVHLDANGAVLEAPISLVVDGGVVIGPDHPQLRSNLLLRSLEALRAQAQTHGARAPIASPDHRWLLSKAQVEALHVAGFRVVPWTVNEPARMEELLGFGVDGLITDRPDLAQVALDAGRDVQGHRGARGLAPENTLGAFLAGLDAGATVLELDLTGTADDEALVWHDARLASPKCPTVGDGGLLIPATRLNELTRVRCDGLLPEYPRQRRSALHRPMTLAEALRLPGRLNVETKVHGTGLPHDDAAWLTRLLVRRVLEADAGARVTLQSFDWRSLELAHREAPWLQTVALFGTTDTVNAPDERRAGLPWKESIARPTLARSGGFEDLALTSDGAALIAMLEKPLPGERSCLGFRFELATKQWSLAFRYPLDERASAVGDLTMIDARSGYAVERDDTERRLDGFKRLVRFTLPARAGDEVAKAPAADLLDLELPDGGTFSFPFWTIEGVAVLPNGRVAIVNDNNFPFGRGRSETAPDDSELIVIEPLR